MAPRRRLRPADVKWVVAATLALATAIAFVVGAVVVTRGQGSAAECGIVRAGRVDDVRARIVTSGPYFVASGARCGFWLTLEGDEIVAYRRTVPGRTDCVLSFDRERRTFTCGDDDVADRELARYPTEVREATNDDGTVRVLVVDTRPDAERAADPEPGPDSDG